VCLASSGLGECHSVGQVQAESKSGTRAASIHRRAPFAGFKNVGPSEALSYRLVPSGVTDSDFLQVAHRAWGGEGMHL
jgi:hypothetical protein